MIIKYNISKHNKLGLYIVWKETKTERGYGCKGVFQGSRKECKQYLEELKND